MLWTNVRGSARARRARAWEVTQYNTPSPQGGPGGSSLSGGLVSEFGPFFPASDGSLSLTPNAWSWTQSANVIFLEQPAGVGFSWSATTSDYITGDAQSAADVYAFLQAFLVRYPQYVGRALYLSGESYGGHYVPSFAAAIVAGNAAGGATHLPLVGFAVGNAWTVAELDNTGAVDFWHSRTMIDDATRAGILATCNMSDVGPLAARGAVRAEADWELAAGVRAGSKRRPLGFTPRLDARTGRAATLGGLDCDGFTDKAFALIAGVDIYDVYSNICTQQSPAPPALAASLGVDSNGASGCALSYDACRDAKTTRYLNDAAVKAAIHANASITWQGCSSVVDYSRFDLLTSMLPVYRSLMAAGLRIWVYSGDVDAIVPSLGSRAWIAALNLTQKAKALAFRRACSPLASPPMAPIPPLC
jgi:serine carboxypeptidase-like clade 2